MCVCVILYVCVCGIPCSCMSMFVHYTVKVCVFICVFCVFDLLTVISQGLCAWELFLEGISGRLYRQPVMSLPLSQKKRGRGDQSGLRSGSR